MKKILVLFGFILTIIGCTSSGGENGGDTNNFDRKALLTNWANNIIVPSYTNYQTKLQSLSGNVNTFTTTPTESNLQLVRTSWLESYKAFQTVTLFNFGKAEEINFNMVANTYPTDVTGIENNITNGTYNLNMISQFSKQGFPALDYLLNGLGSTDSAIVGFYSSNANATKYKKYLSDIVSKLKTDVDAVVTDWNSGYKTTYIANDGTSVTSSVNVTTNLFVKNLEKDIRTGKLGIPAGLFSGGTKFPEKVEAFYKKDVSKELFLNALQSQQDFFNGKHFSNSTTGASLKSFLEDVNATRDGKKLGDIINTQFEAVKTSASILNSNFSEQVTSDNTKMTDTYDVLQQNVIYIKLDMMQALNITIDYVDSDGD